MGPESMKGDLRGMLANYTDLWNIFSKKCIFSEYGFIYIYIYIYIYIHTYIYIYIYGVLIIAQNNEYIVL